MCGNFTLFMNKRFQIWDHFFPLLFLQNFENPKSSDIGLLWVGAKIPLNRVNKWKKKHKFFFAAAILHPLLAKKKLNLRTLCAITFPQGFQKSKFFWLWTSGRGGKKGSEKVWRTNKHTNRHTDISTYRKNRPRGPILGKNNTDLKNIFSGIWQYCQNRDLSTGTADLLF